MHLPRRESHLGGLRLVRDSSSNPFMSSDNSKGLDRLGDCQYAHGNGVKPGILPVKVATLSARSPRSCTTIRTAQNSWRLMRRFSRSRVSKRCDKRILLLVANPTMLGNRLFKPCNTFWQSACRGQKRVTLINPLSP